MRPCVGRVSDHKIGAGWEKLPPVPDTEITILAFLSSGPSSPAQNPPHPGNCPCSYLVALSISHTLGVSWKCVELVNYHPIYVVSEYIARTTCSLPTKRSNQVNYAKNIRVCRAEILTCSSILWAKELTSSKFSKWRTWNWGWEGDMILRLKLIWVPNLDHPLTMQSRLK